jgi:hypothetical protein
MTDSASSGTEFRFTNRLEGFFIFAYILPLATAYVYQTMPPGQSSGFLLANATGSKQAEGCLMIASRSLSDV